METQCSGGEAQIEVDAIPHRRQATLPESKIHKDTTVVNSRIDIANVTTDYLQQYRNHNHGRQKACWCGVNDRMEVGAKIERKATVGIGEDKSNGDSYPRIPPLPKPVRIQTDQNGNHTTIKTPMGHGDVDKEKALTTGPHR